MITPTVALTNPSGAAFFGNPDGDGRTFSVLLALALSGNYGTAGSHGDVFSFASINNPELPSSQIPQVVWVFEQQVAGAAPSFYQGTYNSGGTRDTGSISFSLGGVETPAAGAAYSGAILTTNWFAQVVFPMFV
jgi:hypothetical protein